MKTWRNTAPRRLVTIVTDQAISSGSNILIAILAARVLDATSFGLFSLLFVIFMVTQGAARALVGQPAMVQPEDTRQRLGEVTGAGLAVGVVIGVATAVAGLVTMIWFREAGLALVVLAAFTPLLILQDLGRYVAFTLHQPQKAIALDLLWLVLSLVGVGFVIGMRAETVTWFIVAWAGSGAASALLLFWQYPGTRFARIESGRRWLGESRSISWRFAMSFVSTHGGLLIASLGLMGILGARGLGAIRGALLLYGPIVQIHAAAMAAGVAEVSRLSPRSPDVRKNVQTSTIITTAAAIGCLAILVVLPDGAGEFVLGDTWSTAEPILLPIGLHRVLVSAVCGAQAALVGFRALDKTLRIDIATTVLTAGAMILAAALGGVVAACWSTVGAQIVVVALWWVTYARYRRANRQAATTQDTFDSTPT